MGLLCATLRHFAARPAPPRVVLCTHFRRGRQGCGLDGGLHAVQCGLPQCDGGATGSIAGATQPLLQHHRASFCRSAPLPSPPLTCCSEVLQPQYLPCSPQLAFFTMSVVVQGAEGTEQQQQQQADAGAAGRGLVFLYRLVPGHAAPSFGVHCAQLAGVPEAALERARKLIAAQVGAWCGGALQLNLGSGAVLQPSYFCPPPTAGERRCGTGSDWRAARATHHYLPRPGAAAAGAQCARWGGSAGSSGCGAGGHRPWDHGRSRSFSAPLSPAHRPGLIIVSDAMHLAMASRASNQSPHSSLTNVHLGLLPDRSGPPTCGRCEPPLALCMMQISGVAPLQCRQKLLAARSLPPAVRVRPGAAVCARAAATAE